MRKKLLNDLPLSHIKNKEDLIIRLLRLYEYSKDHKLKWEEETERFYRAYLGEQWYAPESGVPLVLENWRMGTTRNHIFSTINSFKATMTDNRPIIYAVARKPEDEDLADQMSQIIHAVWQTRGIDAVIDNWLLDGLISGVGFLKTYWNVPQDDIGIAVISPFDIYIDPHAPNTDPIKGAKYVIHKFEMDIEEIDTLYPRKVDEILRGGELVSDEPERRPHPLYGRRIEEEDTRRFTGMEFWIRDESKIPITHDDKTLEEIPAYPKGRVVTLIGSTIVRDTENPFTHGRFPFVPFIDHYVPRQVWPMGEVKQTESPQQYINALLSQILTNVQGMANVQWKVEEGAIKSKDLTAEPGLVVTVARGKFDKVQKIEGSALPPNVYQILLDMESSIQKITGLTDYSTGRRPTSLVHTSGIALASAQEASQTPIRIKVRHMETGLVELGFQFLGLIQQFYPVDKYISYVTNGQQTHIQFNQKLAAAEFSIQVESGSTLPVNKIDKANQILNIYDRLIQLAQVGVVDPLALTRWMLEQIDIPGTYPLITLLTQAKEPIQYQAPQGGIEGEGDYDEVRRILGELTNSQEQGEEQ